MPAPDGLLSTTLLLSSGSLIVNFALYISDVRCEIWDVRFNIVDNLLASHIPHRISLTSALHPSYSQSLLAPPREPRGTPPIPFRAAPK